MPSVGLIYMFGGIALFAAFIAYRADEKAVRYFFIGVCLLNAFGAIHVQMKRDPWALSTTSRPYR